MMWLFWNFVSMLSILWMGQERMTSRTLAFKYFFVQLRAIWLCMLLQPSRAFSTFSFLSYFDPSNPTNCVLQLSAKDLHVNYWSGSYSERQLVWTDWGFLSWNYPNVDRLGFWSGN